MAKKSKLRRYPLAPLPAGLPNQHALLVTPVAFAFETLRISAAFRDRIQWHPIHSPAQPLLSMELENGRERERQAYNDRCTQQARRDKKTVLGTHAGFCDFFVPIAAEPEPVLLITGPLSASRPTSAELLERFFWLTGRQGHPSDPEFVRYVALTLDTLLLEGDALRHYQRMVECLALLCAGQGDAHALAAEASELRTRLESTRFADHAWLAARSMVDARSERAWFSPHKLNELVDLGLSQPPEHVLVCLWTRRQNAGDGVDEMLAHDAFQRACIELARKTGDVLAGRVGDQGVMFLASGGMSKRKSRDLLLRIGEQARALGRRKFGVGLHLGLSASDAPVPTSIRYEEALGAAEAAMAQGVPLVTATPGQRATLAPLRELRDKLGDLTSERPATLATRFEHYRSAVNAQCGYRIEVVRAHLDAGFERAAQGLRRTGIVGERSLAEAYDALDRAAQHAESLNDLGAAYRHAISELVAAAEHPVTASQDRNLRRSLEFVQRHFTEPISLGDVARVAGVAPRHFTRLFRQQQSTTFEAHLRKLRVERGKQLLAGTDLSVERIAQLSGFALRPHFHRVFRSLVGQTPAQYRSSYRHTSVYT